MINYLNNSPRIYKRSFHSTKSLSIVYDLITETLNVLKLEDIMETVKDGKAALKASNKVIIKKF
jgi:hypothetical protein